MSNRRSSWTQATPMMQQISVIACLEHTIKLLESKEISTEDVVGKFKDGVSQLVELQPYLEKGCWNNESSKLTVQAADQVLSMIFDANTPPEKINGIIFKIKSELDKRNTRRLKRISIEDSKLDLSCPESKTDV